MEVERPQYLEKLLRKKDNGRIKIVTGIRRCGKSYLLFELYTRRLREMGVADDQIVGIALDEIANAKYRDPIELDRYIRERIADGTKRYYVMIDEIQFVSEIRNPYVDDPQAKLTFVDVVLGLARIKNADIYITGSNSRMLSSDILTQFRDRGDEIRVFPLSYAEFLSIYRNDPRGAWSDYCTYGGMPLVWTFDSHEERSKYLRDLFANTYVRDVVERHHIKKDASVLEDLLNILSSAVGSLTNPRRLADTFASECKLKVDAETIGNYLEWFRDAFLIEKAVRYDVKGKRYMNTPFKYYFTDVGLRNARLQFRQQEENHIMENVLYNDLLRRGYDVDVGVVEQNGRDEAGKKVRKQLEVDFVVNRGDRRYYIQSAWSVDGAEKRRQETASLLRIPDSFRKIVVTRDYAEPRYDDNGILYVGAEQFLTREDLLDT